MKIYYEKFLKFVGTIVLTWVFLIFSKLFDFNFGIRIKNFFWPVLILTLIFLFLEIGNNYNFLCPLIIEFIKRIKIRFRIKVYLTLKKTFFVNLSKYFGKRIVKAVAYFVTFLQIVWDFFSKRVFQPKHLVFLFLLGVFFDVFILSIYSDLLVFLLICILIANLNIYSIEGKRVVTWSFFLLVLCVFFLITEENIYAERISTWLFILLLIGVLRETSSLLKETWLKPTIN